MAKFTKINTLQIGNHVWHFTDPQIIEYRSDENGVEMKAILRIQHEEDVKDEKQNDRESQKETNRQ